MQQNGRKALVPFVTVGYPSKKATLPILDAMARAGADAIELGIPFSDPLADGPVIQASSQKSLDAGTTLKDAFSIARSFRKRHDTPLFFMTYANPVVRAGIRSFFRRCRDTGISGVIIPDLPPEESVSFEGRDVPLVYLCAPTCNEKRIRTITAKSEPFVYLVSLKGVTGTRDRLPSDLNRFVRRVRRHTKKPLYVGFGISTPAHAKAVARVADGVIIGSAILRRAAGGARKVGAYVSSIRKALDRS